MFQTKSSLFCFYPPNKWGRHKMFFLLLVFKPSSRYLFLFYPCHLSHKFTQSINLFFNLPLLLNSLSFVFETTKYLGVMLCKVTTKFGWREYTFSARRIFRISWVKREYDLKKDSLMIPCPEVLLGENQKYWVVKLNNYTIVNLLTMPLYLKDIILEKIK